jgi:hypothetical protein
MLAFYDPCCTVNLACDTAARVPWPINQVRIQDAVWSVSWYLHHIGLQSIRSTDAGPQWRIDASKTEAPEDAKYEIDSQEVIALSKHLLFSSIEGVYSDSWVISPRLQKVRAGDLPKANHGSNTRLR